MAAGQYNFTIEQGTTVNFEVQYSDSDSNPIDLTGYDHARMQIRQGPGSDLIIYLSSSTSGKSAGIIELGNPAGSDSEDYMGLSLLGPIITPPSTSKPLESGSIGVFISAKHTSNFDFDKAQYDLELVSGSGTNPIVYRILEGKIKLSKEITKD